MRGTILVAVPAAALVAHPAAADTLWDNGMTDGVGGYSNATSGVFGFRRTLLDDFLLESDGTRVQGLRWYSVWGTPMGASQGDDGEFCFRFDDDGTPGEIFATANVTAYSEEHTGRVFFSREEVVHWVTFDDIVLDEGKYWFEGTVAGPENNFWLTAQQQLDECWVNYEDLGGFNSGTDQFGVASDIAWSLLGVALPACGADLDGDGFVAFSDLLFILSSWGICPPQSGCPEDIDGSGEVDFGDILVLLGQWGGPCIPTETGSCCFGDGGCNDVTHAVCLSQGGAFLGKETVCTDGCPGACCFDDEACTDGTLPAECLAMGGTFEGNAVTCAEVQCPTVPVGACCLDDGTCLEPTSEVNCAIAEGRYQGGGSICAEVTCHVLGPCGWIIDAPFTWTGNTCEEQASCALQPSRDVQWFVTVPRGGAWTFSVCGAGADTILYADRSSCCGDEFESDDFCGLQSELTVNLLSSQVIVITLETKTFIGCGPFTLVVSSE